MLEWKHLSLQRHQWPTSTQLQRNPSCSSLKMLLEITWDSNRITSGLKLKSMKKCPSCIHKADFLSGSPDAQVHLVDCIRNFITGYRVNDPSVKAIEWRLIAGIRCRCSWVRCCGFASFPFIENFETWSVWIPSLLEEAENEECTCWFVWMLLMHQLWRGALVYATQIIADSFADGNLPWIRLPKSMHRLNRIFWKLRLKLTSNVIKHIWNTGTRWMKDGLTNRLLDILSGIGLSDNAKWSDVLKCMMADECNHQMSINHLCGHENWRPESLRQITG